MNTLIQLLVFFVSERKGEDLAGKHTGFGVRAEFESYSTTEEPGGFRAATCPL